MYTGISGQDRQLTKLYFFSFTSTLLVLKREYSGRTRSIPCLLNYVLLVLPGHQQLWCYLCKIKRSLSFMRKYLKYLHSLSGQEMIENTCIFVLINRHENFQVFTWFRVFCQWQNTWNQIKTLLALKKNYAPIFIHIIWGKHSCAYLHVWIVLMLF